MKGEKMGAKVDQSQGFYGWDLEPEANETGYATGSMEDLFWPLYRQLYTAIRQHNDVKALQWHCRTLELLREQVQNLIVSGEADADKTSDTNNRKCYSYYVSKCRRCVQTV